ncbi:MAG: C45 family peptidase [Candidatus Caldarchaeum sp.]|nr:C45 family peptidase [Candidatus Caldarchaeum sp.]
MVILAEGSDFERGLSVGRHARKYIHLNLVNFAALCRAACFSWNRLSEDADMVSRGGLLPESMQNYLRGMSEGASIPYRRLVAYNLFHNSLLPEECTVLIAMGDSTKNGNTIMLKNSDKIGSEKLVGDRYHSYKEVNVVVAEKPDDGHAFIAVAAAGEISIKMGLNDKGVATGSNISRTWELRQRKVDLTGLRALDRGWLMREGISKNPSAQSAASTALNHLLSNPMSTPGNIEFVDAGEAIVIEGSYDRLAVQKTSDGVIARSNRFNVLESLNDPEDVSSYARYVRAMQLLNSNRKQITSEMMTVFSQDHVNGPGPNSICRHSPDFREETSLSAAVMEINRSNARRSTIHVCLGKPCYAWKSEKGHILLDFYSVEEGLPREFTSGEAFKTHYTEKPFET